MERVDTEWLALRAGIKPGIRVSADVVSAPAIAERYQRFGCSVVMTHGRIGLERRPRVLLYIGGTPQAAAGLRAAEAHLLDPKTTPRDKAFFTREFGARLGYPRCCVDAFAERTRRGSGLLRDGDRDRHDPDYVHVHEAWVPRPDWRLNNLLMAHHIRLISFAPCRFDCASALAQAQAIHRLVGLESADLLPVLEDRLRRPLVVGPDGARAWVRLDRNKIAAVEPPREPDGPPSQPSPTDLARTPAWSGADVTAEGRVQARGEPPPRLLDFASVR